MLRKLKGGDEHLQDAKKVEGGGFLSLEMERSELGFNVVD